MNDAAGRPFDTGTSWKNLTLSTVAFTIVLSTFLVVNEDDSFGSPGWKEWA